MRMTEQELEAYIRQYTELEKECMKSRFRKLVMKKHNL